MASYQSHVRIGRASLSGDRRMGRFWGVLAILVGATLEVLRMPSVVPAPQGNPTVKVMFVGGSIAKGEGAPNQLGYLQQAFLLLTHHGDVQYSYQDEAISGANGHQLATLYKGQYQQWLSASNPQIVVISWGLLNDALPRTPMVEFKHYLKSEIDLALENRAKVFIVTPPVTEATYRRFPQQEQAYASAEMQLVAHMKNPDVLAFDVFDEMKRYIAVHHQTIRVYTADPNHPNAAGHRLAGRLLYRDIRRTADVRTPT